MSLGAITFTKDRREIPPKRQTLNLVRHSGFYVCQFERREIGISPASVENNVVLPAMRDAPWPLLISAVYTALLAPGVLWLLNRAGHRPTRGSGRRAWGSGSAHR